MAPSAGLMEVDLSSPTTLLASPRTHHSSGTVDGSSQVDADLTPSHWCKRLRLSSGSLSGNGKWETSDCYRNLGYICQMPRWLNLEQLPFGCVEDWPGYQHSYQGFGYRFETEKKTWMNAEADCVNQGAHLTSIHSQEELDFLLGEKLHHKLQLQL